MARVSLALFGPLRMLLNQRPITKLESDKVRALVIFLAVESERAQHRALLADLLWPELPERAARHNLSQALFNLRQVLGDQTAATPLLLIARDTVQFNIAGDYELDVQTFDALIAACATHRHRAAERCRPCAQRLERAVALYQGDFLAQFSLDDNARFEEWVHIRRERYAQNVLASLATLAAFHEGRGEYRRALEYSQRSLELEPWAEPAYRFQMRVLARDGQRAQALALYERCREILAAELGVEPDAETQAVYEAIRAAGDMPSEHNTARSAETTRLHHLPAALTPFVGREAEQAQVADLLAEPQCRLVTLHGPGGIGKTRLALQVASEHAEQYADGVWFVALAQLFDPAFLMPAIADALDIPVHGADDPLVHVCRSLHDKELLLVLDNFEQLVAAAPQLSELLRSVAGLTLLVTSRERLALQCEWLVDIGGLAIPAPGHDDDVDDSSAGQLWIQTARRSRMAYTLSGEDRGAVARICRLVEGMPLAIELAAAWAYERQPSTIADEIADRIGSLTTPWGDVHERHRSFEAVLAHSWQLLPTEEQQVLRRLSVFRGGFDREAAARVAGASVVHLEALTDKSLLRRNGSCQADARYDIHEIIRQHAAEYLEASGEAIAVAVRHLDIVADLAGEANRSFGSADEKRWVARLETEHANLRAALSWSLNTGAISQALQVACDAWRFWQVRGHVDEGRQWLKRVLELANHDPQTGKPGLLAQAYKGAGVLAWEQSDYAGAGACFQRSLALYQQHDDDEGLAAVSNNLGVLCMYQGDYAQAEVHLERSLELRRRLGDTWGVSTCLNNLGALAGKQGDTARTQRFYEEALVLCRQIGHDRSIAVLLTNLGDLAEEQGYGERAGKLWAESLALHRSLKHTSGAAKVLTRLGAAAIERCELAEARAFYSESLAMLQTLGEKEYIAVCLEGFAALALAQRHWQRAAQLWGAAEALRDSISVPLAPSLLRRYHQKVATGRAQLPPATFDAAWSQGRALSLEQATALASDSSATYSCVNEIP